jgi:uncharacterized protein (DUF2141 family)
MTKITSLLLLAGTAMLATAFSVRHQANELEITLEGVQHKGMLIVGLYKEKDGFPKKDKAYRILDYKPVGESTVVVKFSGLEKGTYAVALFQDLNNNGKLDKNFFGVPTEPYAFSNNVTPKLSAPVYDDCKFLLPNQSKQRIRIFNP